ncbi:hypothetical protein PAXINDRAFT_15024 [Paxillus involutus ATCC 200175]|uniref:Unplaced genomic scaffold PAXINscaffold_46, whole genome shotgun sequence n=1 Tax=Paxillus involutus ATCC 200175 TaxID=664439 RepID=A0A0C9STI8_PAXIN|nr:hypothetical protein PAXINDRAFT_15024 [Paxillus involutus ATCC 200175]
MDAHSGYPIEQPLQHEEQLHTVTFSTSGEFMASGGNDRKVSIWRVLWWDETQKQVITTLMYLPTPVLPYSLPKTHHSSGLLDTAWNLDEINRSNFAQDLTGYVVREGAHPFASGSFGDIYRGKLPVAVKAIRTYTADDSDYTKKNKRLRRELKTWANLEHTNILSHFGTSMGFGRFPAMVPEDDENPLDIFPTPQIDVYSFGRIMLQGKSLTTTISATHKCCLQFYKGSFRNGPGRALVTDRQWTFMQRCWMLVDVGEPRPHDDEIVEFARQELDEIEKAFPDYDGTSTWANLEHTNILPFFGTTMGFGRFPAMVPEDDENPLDIFPTPQSDVYSFGRIMLQGKSLTTTISATHKCCLQFYKGSFRNGPGRALVTDRQWTFMQRCWMLVDVGEPRPHDDEIVEFARQELDEIEKAFP